MNIMLMIICIVEIGSSFDNSIFANLFLIHVLLPSLLFVLYLLL